jgi:hypothetical protein
MRTAGAAFAWEFGRRHRWGVIVLAGYFLVLAGLRLLVAGPLRVNFDDAQSFALFVVVPGTAMFMYFIALFTYGLTGDLAQRQSIYPARLFALPVSTAALAGWPMLYGTLSMSLLWFATRFLGVWPSEEPIPLIWPALLVASLLAWAQALTWMSYPLPGLRVIVTVLWLVSIDVVVFTALEFRPRESVMIAILSPNLPLAFLVARFALGRARRGDVPDWRDVFAPLATIAGTSASRREHFPSAARAQFWFEWRRHGWSLPGWVAILVPFELSLLFVFPETPVIIFETLLGVLLTPPFMASFVAAAVSTSNRDGKDVYGLTPFMATRPMTSAALIAAKLKMTLWSTVAAWIPVLAGIPLALRLSGTAPTVAEWGSNLAHFFGKPRAIVMLLLGLAMLVLSTWKQLVQGLFIGLSGRAWLVKARVFGALSLLGVIVPVAHWVIHSRVAIAALWKLFPWFLAVMVVLKLTVGAWVAARLLDKRLLSGRTLLAGAASWDLAVFALYGLLVWVTPAILFHRYILALLAILAIPLARLSAAPLALAWNRHRP